MSADRRECALREAGGYAPAVFETNLGDWNVLVVRRVHLH
jgi:hypothetical protein